jgi:hypothetical protein
VRPGRVVVSQAFRAAGLSFPWRHLKGPRKGETDWKPLAHHTMLRVLPSATTPAAARSCPPTPATATASKTGTAPAP